MTITAKKIYTEGAVLNNKKIIVENGLITAIENFNGSTDYDNLAPALFDTHINGGEKYYFTQNPSIKTLEDMVEASFKHGTAFILPCLITSSTENILTGIAAVRQYMVAHPNGAIPGMHLEGPYLNIKKRGAHLTKYVRKPTDTEIDEIIEAGKDTIKIWTIAPENFSASQIAKIQAAGIRIAAGHSDATVEEAHWAFEQNINLVTHLYNAMSAFGHRAPGLIGATLADDRVWAPIILDGHHCHYEAAKMAFKAKKDKLFLISDALFLGGKKLKFQWEEFDATLTDGQYRNTEGNLAGAAISLADCIRNAVEKVEIPLATALSMATDRPVAALNYPFNFGKIVPGYKAVFTAFADDLSAFRVIR